MTNALHSFNTRPSLDRGTGDPPALAHGLAQINARLSDLGRQLASIDGQTSVAGAGSTARDRPHPTPDAGSSAEAGRIIADAQARAAEVLADVEARATEVVTRAEARVSELEGEIRALIAVRDRLDRSIEAPRFSGVVSLLAHPVGDTMTVVSLERALASSPGVGDVYLRKLDGGQAEFEVSLTEPVALIGELRQRFAAPFAVTEQDPSRLILDLRGPAAIPER
jgi:hypothetical protein